MARRSKKTSGTPQPISHEAAATSPATWPVWLKHDWFLGLLLLLAVLVAYQPSWRAGYVWDDDIVVTNNPVIAGPLGLKEIWTTRAADICPLTLTTFWLEHRLWGTAPLPYHLVTIFLHGGCAVLLWQVLRRLGIPGAWLGAALWALHPVAVESVAWISEMKNTQSGFFFLLAILFFVRDLDPNSPGSRPGRDYALTLLFSAMAIASKSSTVILPLVLCLCAWWMEGRWRWRNLVRVSPIFLMSIAAGLVSIWTQHQSRSMELIGARSWPERLVTAGDAVWFYLGKLIWPSPLMAIYPRWQIDAGGWLSWLPLLVVMIVLLYFWFERGARPFFFAFVYYLLALLPALGLVTMTFFGYSFVADHFQYLASMGPLALVGAIVARLAELVMPGRMWLQIILGATLLGTMGTVSWQRAWVYQNGEALWKDELEKNPNSWGGYNDLGTAYFYEGRVEDAIVLLQQALDLNPRYADAYYNLGRALAQKREMDEARIDFQKALDLDPDLVEAQNNLGIILAEKGEMDEAIAHFQKTVQLSPGFAQGHYNLGVALVRKGRLEEAIPEFQEAVRLSPDFRDAQNNLANAQAEVAKKNAPASKGDH